MSHAWITFHAICTSCNAISGRLSCRCRLTLYFHAMNSSKHSIQLASLFLSFMINEWEVSNAKQNLIIITQMISNATVPRLGMTHCGCCTKQMFQLQFWYLKPHTFHDLNSIKRNTSVCTSDAVWTSEWLIQLCDRVLNICFFYAQY